ncbi:MAG: metallophosphoesterase family protein [Bacillota bacterium]|nr:metallophosphoesterase family protein [Bacillota bacterium]
MSTFNRLSQIFRTADIIPFDDSSKIVLISDCHRGDGSWVDDFGHNKNIYYSAIKYYYNEGFTYIDLGDSDELWKNKKFSDISNIYNDVFELLHKFYAAGRYYMIYGNHDMIKRDQHFVEQNLYRYYNSEHDTFEPLFENIKVHEGLILKHLETNIKILLIHGHQGDLLDDVFWWFGRFLVRYMWRRLEFFGLKDPTSAAKNYAKKRKVERKITQWVAVNKQVVIAGHTHRPTSPSEDEVQYFNEGSCVHPNCITTIEICDSEITLVKWGIKTKEDRSLFVSREVIAAPKKIINLKNHPRT